MFQKFVPMLFGRFIGTLAWRRGKVRGKVSDFFVDFYFLI